MGKNRVPETFTIRLHDLMILYVNLYRAVDNPKVGFVDAENQLQFVLKQVTERTVSLKQHELEALLWACVQLSEQPSAKENGQFWHPYKVGVNRFIKKMIHHNVYRFYFDKIYCYFRENKPKQGVPPEAIVTVESDRAFIKSNIKRGK